MDILKKIKVSIEQREIFNMEIKIEEKNTLWKFVITDPLLLNKNGGLKAKVKQLATKIDKMDMDWDLIIYKDLVAFKLPTERKTYIYSKKILG